MRKSCNGCYFEHNRTCYWFKNVQGNDPKVIPVETFNKGCSQYNNTFTGNKLNELISKIVTVFNGEIIGEKYKPKKWSGNYRKKKYTTRHNYTKRKDF